MKTIILLTASLFSTFSSLAQTSTNTDSEFQILEVQPEPEGGLSGFYKYVVNNMKYPEDARDLGIEGKVHVSFVIDEQGKIPTESVGIFQGVYPSLDQEAMRLIKESPDWTPGRKTVGGETAKVRMVVPIIFKLDTKSKKKNKMKKG